MSSMQPKAENAFMVPVLIAATIVLVAIWCGPRAAPVPVMPGPAGSTATPTTGEEPIVTIETELFSLARLGQAMRARQRGRTRADIADAEVLGREFDARVREILGEPAEAAVEEKGDR